MECFMVDKECTENCAAHVSQLAEVQKFTGWVDDIWSTSFHTKCLLLAKKLFEVHKL